MREETSAPASLPLNVSGTQVQKFSDVETRQYQRIYLNSFLDKMLNGFVPGQVILVSGEPGIGKSTLLLQMLEILRQMDSSLSPIYISSEETAEQISTRCEDTNIDVADLYVCATRKIDTAIAAASYVSSCVAFDSINEFIDPEVSNRPGSVVQIRHSAARIVTWTKARNAISFIVGHVDRSGEIAGPETLQHAVDTVLFLEYRGDKRFLTVQKNRFGKSRVALEIPMRETGGFDI